MKSHSVSLSLVAICLPLLGLTACGGSGSAAASPDAEAGGKHAIVLRRELEPGKSHPLQVKDESSQHTVTSVAGKVAADVSTTTLLSFVGTERALSAGRDQPEEYVVEELTRTTDGKTVELLPKGAKLASKPDGKEWQYELEGKPVSEEVSDALHTLLGRTVGGPTDDEIFGTKQPRAVGESWNVDVNHLPPDEHIAFNPEGASGSMRFVGVRKVGETDCLDLQADLSVPSVSLKGLPEGAKVRSASMTGKFAGLFPADIKLASPSQSMVIDVKLQMEVAAPQGAVVVDMTVHNDHSQNRR